MRLLAIDHTHAFTLGRDLSARMSRIAEVQDEKLYGLFPEFCQHLNRAALTTGRQRLREADTATMGGFVDEVPREWTVPEQVRDAWVDFLVRRAAFLVDMIGQMLEPYLPQAELF